MVHETKSLLGQHPGQFLTIQNVLPHQLCFLPRNPSPAFYTSLKAILARSEFQHRHNAVLCFFNSLQQLLIDLNILAAGHLVQFRQSSTQECRHSAIKTCHHTFYVNTPTPHTNPLTTTYLLFVIIEWRRIISNVYTVLCHIVGLFITFLIIEWLGRRRTIALEFFIFSVFVYLVNICITR